MASGQFTVTEDEIREAAQHGLLLLVDRHGEGRWCSAWNDTKVAQELHKAARQIETREQAANG